MQYLSTIVFTALTVGGILIRPTRAQPTLQTKPPVDDFDKSILITGSLALMYFFKIKIHW
jgi:hypothetical protein